MQCAARRANPQYATEHSGRKGPYRHMAVRDGRTAAPRNGHPTRAPAASAGARSTDAPGSSPIAARAAHWPRPLWSVAVNVLPWAQRALATSMSCLKRQPIDPSVSTTAKTNARATATVLSSQRGVARTRRSAQRRCRRNKACALPAASGPLHLCRASAGRPAAGRSISCPPRGAMTILPPGASPGWAAARSGPRPLRQTTACIRRRRSRPPYAPPPW